MTCSMRARRSVLGHRCHRPGQSAGGDRLRRWANRGGWCGHAVGLLAARPPAVTYGSVTYATVGSARGPSDQRPVKISSTAGSGSAGDEVSGTPTASTAEVSDDHTDRRHRGCRRYCLVVAFVLRARRNAQLRNQFGPEYDRTIDESAASAPRVEELKDRKARHDELELTPLDPSTAQRLRDAMAAGAGAVRRCPGGVRCRCAPRAAHSARRPRLSHARRRRPRRDVVGRPR